MLIIEYIDEIKLELERFMCLFPSQQAALAARKSDAGGTSGCIELCRLRRADEHARVLWRPEHHTRAPGGQRGRGGIQPIYVDGEVEHR